MDKVKTTAILCIVCIVMVGVLIFLNRDKFKSEKKEEIKTEKTEATAAAE